MANLKLFAVDLWARKVLESVKKSLAFVVDSGNKNYLPFTGSTSASGSYIFNGQAVNIPAGDYVIYVKKLFPDAVSYSFKHGNTVVASLGTWRPSGPVGALRVHLSQDVNTFNFWVGANNRIEELMVCSLDAWKISKNYVPWRGQPTPPPPVESEINMLSL